MARLGVMVGLVFLLEWYDGTGYRTLYFDQRVDCETRALMLRRSLVYIRKWCEDV